MMPISLDEISFELPMDFDKYDAKLTASEKKEVKNLIREYVEGEIFSMVSNSNSPVAGEGKFPKLNKKYADREKNGDREANLDLTGSMLDALKSRNTSDGIVFEITKAKEIPKAYNHNVGDTLPKRQFLPNEGETFKKSILTGIDGIIEDFINEKIQD